MLTLTGQLLAGKYRVGDRLGSGGMGEVYEAVQEGLGRRVAVKVMSGPMASDPQLLERFQREARAVAALGHPHIVQVTDFQDNPGEPPFLVMERLIGESLGDLLEREPMVTPPRACRIAEQTLSALSAAHDAGLVHRDVKPDNIFLCQADTGSDIVKLLDFGVAKAMEETQHGKLTSTGAIVGTLVYMAPEQARGEAIDTRADVYALGACLYHMLAGQPPFVAPNAARLLSMVCNQAPTPLGALRPDLDPGLVAIVTRATAHHAQDRFPSARAMMAAIGSYLRGEATLLPSSAPATDPMSATAFAGVPSPYATGPSSPYGTPAPSTGPRWVPSAPPMSPPIPSPYAHPGSGGSAGGVVVAPYQIAASAPPPPRRSAGLVVGLALVSLVGGAAVAGTMVLRNRHHKPVAATAQATTTAPPPATLVSAGEPTGDITSLSPVASGSVGGVALTVPTPIVPRPPTINTPPPPSTGGTAANAANVGQLAMQMSKSFQSGDGKTCLQAYDQLRASPGTSSYIDSYASIHAYCLMEAGRCSEGRKELRAFYNQPRPIMQQMTAQQIEQSVSSTAQMYCPASQLAAPERVQRAQLLLLRAQSSHDTAGAARYADEMAGLLGRLPRSTQEERSKLVGYEYQVGKAYGDVGRCSEARRHFHEECGLNGAGNADICAKSLLNSTSGCKSSP
jgi:serine/threonine protein kinase